MAVILPEGGRQVIEKTECLRISKSVLQFITLNIQGLKNKIPELTKATLDFNNHAIIMLTESRNAKESSFSDNDYLYLLGAADKHCGGVGWLIPLCYKNNLVSYQHIGFRLSTITLKLKNTYLLIIVCYMPTSSSEDSKVEEVYDQMKEIMSGFKKLYPLSRNNIIIGGDFNAKIKCTIRRGKFSNSAHLENNERGTKLDGQKVKISQ
uniref:Endo/exonuclease/phosphatase domain-containing protein n=1 Tax=Strongyloides papillosus TaxID=174720 RepID=A0A0N5BKV7_STREA